MTKICDCLVIFFLISAALHFIFNKTSFKNQSLYGLLSTASSKTKQISFISSWEKNAKKKNWYYLKSVIRRIIIKKKKKLNELPWEWSLARVLKVNKKKLCPKSYCSHYLKWISNPISLLFLTLRIEVINNVLRKIFCFFFSFFFLLFVVLSFFFGTQTSHFDVVKMKFEKLNFNNRK